MSVPNEKPEEWTKWIYDCDYIPMSEYKLNKQGKYYLKPNSPYNTAKNTSSSGSPSTYSPSTYSPSYSPSYSPPSQYTPNHSPGSSPPNSPPYTHLSNFLSHSTAPAQYNHSLTSPLSYPRNYNSPLTDHGINYYGMNDHCGHIVQPPRQKPNYLNYNGK
jgi:hypothetical protein